MLVFEIIAELSAAGYRDKKKKKISHTKFRCEGALS